MTQLIMKFKMKFTHCYENAAIKDIRKGVKDQAINGPVNAHLIYLPSKAQHIQNLETIWLRNDIDLQYSHPL